MSNQFKHKGTTLLLAILVAFGVYHWHQKIDVERQRNATAIELREKMQEIVRLKTKLYLCEKRHEVE